MAIRDSQSAHGVAENATFSGRALKTGRIPLGTPVAERRHMEVRDGFIVGISNYCDSLCASCPFTSRCRTFADIAEAESAFDPNMQPIIQAAHYATGPAPPASWTGERRDAMDSAADSAADNLGEEICSEAEDRPRRDLAGSDDALQVRAEHYCMTVHAWLRCHEGAAAMVAGEAVAVIAWFHMFIAVKIRRALHSLGDGFDECDWPADRNGSAKVALLGIDRSSAAWQEIVESDIAPLAEVGPFVHELLMLERELEALFPGARSFIRPGFDEPDAVAQLLESER
jgi:hypothetical protein